MNTKKIVTISILGIFLLSAFVSMDLMAAATGPSEHAVNGNQYKGSLAAGEVNQFRFRHRFMFQVQTNASIGVDCDVDVDEVGDQEFQLELNTTNAGVDSCLQIQIRAENTELGIHDGDQIQAKNQHRYRYQQRFMANLSVNATEGLHARLRINCTNPDCCWAYIDEETGDVVPVESEVVDGMLTAETDHFSMWFVLNLDEETTSPAIDGYSVAGILGALMGLGILGAIIIKRKH